MAQAKTLNEIAERIMQLDNAVILTHQYPDGDTVGSAFALCFAMRRLNKHANVIINGKLDRKFDFLKKNYKDEDFDYSSVISVDIASVPLMGDLAEEFGGKVDVSIDHHATNTHFAALSYVNAKAAANAENIMELIKILGVAIDKDIANAVYTGICTDTGCFKFSNVTSDTMRAAAELIDLGADSAEINRVMFDLKSMARIRLERAVLESLSIYGGGKIAVINTTLEMEKETGVGDTDMDGIASIPRQIEGVVIGITIKEKENGVFRISIRTLGDHDASRIAAKFGGGGHKAAAGCRLTGGIDSVKKQIVDEALAELDRVGKRE